MHNKKRMASIIIGILFIILGIILLIKQKSISDNFYKNSELAKISLKNLIYNGK